MLGCSGISTLSASFMHLVEALAVQARRRVEHDVGRALGRPDDVALASTSQVAIARQAGRPQAEPGARRLLAVDVAQHHGMAARGEVAREVGRQRASCRRRPSGWRPRSPACALLVLRFCGYVSGARLPRSSPRLMATIDATPAPRSSGVRPTAEVLVIVAHPQTRAVARQPAPDAGRARAAEQRRADGSRCATCTRSTPTT